MKTDEFIKLVKEMRFNQKEFFRLRKKGDFNGSKPYLNESMKLESQVDKAIKDFENPQANLFEQPERRKVVIEESSDYTIALIGLGFNVRVINCENGQPLVYLVYDNTGKLLGRTGNNKIADFLFKQGYDAKFINSGNTTELVFE